MVLHVSCNHVKCAYADLTCVWEIFLRERLQGVRTFTSLFPGAFILTCLFPAGEAALRGEPRMQSLPVSSVLTNHRTGPPPISPNKRKLSMDQGDDELDCENDHVSKMSRMFNPHL